MCCDHLGGELKRARGRAGLVSKCRPVWVNPTTAGARRRPSAQPGGWNDLDTTEVSGVDRACFEPAYDDFFAGRDVG